DALEKEFGARRALPLLNRILPLPLAGEGRGEGDRAGPHPYPSPASGRGSGLLPRVMSRRTFIQVLGSVGTPGPRGLGMFCGRNAFLANAGLRLTRPRRCPRPRGAGAARSCAAASPSDRPRAAGRTAPERGARARAP